MAEQPRASLSHPCTNFYSVLPHLEKIQNTDIPPSPPGLPIIGNLHRSMWELFKGFDAPEARPRFGRRHFISGYGLGGAEVSQFLRHTDQGQD
ncbi:Psoralen synthase [Bertholletia excelsa]